MASERRHADFERTLREIRERRGDRYLSERLCTIIAQHWEQKHWGRTLAEVRALSPEDYELYRMALG